MKELQDLKDLMIHDVKPVRDEGLSSEGLPRPTFRRCVVQILQFTGLKVFCGL
jgi:hypothetical protein